jgi:hypothetical protein
VRTTDKKRTLIFVRVKDGLSLVKLLMIIQKRQFHGRYLSKERGLVGFIVVGRSACERSLAQVIMSSCYDANIIKLFYFTESR